MNEIKKRGTCIHGVVITQQPAPMAWHSLRTASLPGASPLDLSVHMFNPSSDTHFILIIKVKLLSNLFHILF